MDIPQELDDFIRQSIDHTLGLPVPNYTLQLKIQALEEAHLRLRDQYLTLLSRLKQKDEAFDRAREEACMRARSIKKFVEENQKLANECANLVSQCSRWERECSLYDHDREALMEFGNELDERAKELEIRVHELEQELKRVSEEAQFYKDQWEMRSVGSFKEGTSLEQNLLDELLASLMNKAEDAKATQAFLEANCEIEMCHELLSIWNTLRPSTQNVLSLAAQVWILQKDKEKLRINLLRAEEEVRLLFEENNVVDEENKKLLMLCNIERKHGSGGKHSSSNRTKSNKRKSSRRMTSPSTVERKIDFSSDGDSPRRLISPSKENSPGSKIKPVCS